jgi:hypothetical protein
MSKNDSKQLSLIDRLWSLRCVGLPDQARPIVVRCLRLASLACVPIYQGLWRRSLIERCGGYRLKSRAERTRQAEQWAMHIEIGKGVAPGYDLRGVSESGHQLSQWPLDFENHLCAALHHQRHVTAELDRITETLLSVENTENPDASLAWGAKAPGRREAMWEPRAPSQTLERAPGSRHCGKKPARWLWSY